MNRNIKIAIYIGGIVAVAAILLVYGSFNPVDHPFPKCLFLSVSGLKCPGCGSQRAIHAIMHGDIAQAWRYNALFIAAIPLLAALTFSNIFRKKYTGLYNCLNSRGVIYVVLAVVVAWWILRNIFDW